MKSSSSSTIISLFIKALFPRFLFLAHGMGCIWVIASQEKERKYWYLSVCLVLLVCEGIFNVIVRHGKEFHWFCPSAFFYCVVLTTTMTILREGQIKCIGKENCNLTLDSKNPLAMISNGLNYETQCSVVEQTGMLVLIIGRWLLPQGHISKEAFSQILLIYIGTAADIVEFSEIYGETELAKKLGRNAESVLHGVMAVWALSVTQFALTIALPEEGIRDEDEELERDEEGNAYEETSYFRAKISNKVAPMSYMHYKSMLREGFQQDNKIQERHRRDPTQAQRAFREKYNQTSRTLQSLRMRAGTAESEKKLIELSTKVPGSSLRTVKNGLNKLPPLPPSALNSKSVTSLNMIKSNDQTHKNPSHSGTYSSSKHPFLEGNHEILSIDSPSSIRSMKVGSPKNMRSSRDARTPKQSTSRSTNSTGSNRTAHSADSKKYNLSKEDNPVRKISAWRRLMNTKPFSKKRKRRMQSKDDDDDKHDKNQLGIGRKELNNCFLKYIDLIGILLPVLMQDGPFFILRFVLVVHYQVVTEMIFLLLTKNALVIIIQIYRILLLYCSEPTNEPEMDDPSVRVRTALNTTRRLSQEHSFRNEKVSIAVHAVSRFHTLYTKGHGEERLDSKEKHNFQNDEKDSLQGVKPNQNGLLKDDLTHDHAVIDMSA